MSMSTLYRAGYDLKKIDRYLLTSKSILAQFYDFRARVRGSTAKHNS